MGHAESIGGRIRALRKDRAETQAQAADAIGIARGTLGAIESGHDKPGRDTLAAVARYYGVTMDYIESGAAPPSHLPTEDRVNSVDEAAILLVWGLLDEAQKRLALSFMDALLKGANVTQTAGIVGRHTGLR